jgi:ribosomal protein L14E/L6E/L27E
VKIIRGTVVRSISGHDSGKWFIILSTDGRFALIADGKSRTINNPKRKNNIHLAPTVTVLSEMEMNSDESIRAVLKRFGSKPSEGEVNV